MSTSTAPATPATNRVQVPLDINVIYRKNGDQQVTPHRLTVALLINEFFKVRDHDRTDEGMPKECIRNFCVLVLKLIQSPDIKFEELHNILKTGKFKIHKKVLKHFEEFLAKINSEGITQLLSLVTQIKKLISRESEMVSSRTAMQVNKSSIAGFYLRRLILNFEKLDFSEVVKTLADFKTYYLAHTLSENVTRRKLKVIEGDDWYLNRDKWTRRQAELFIASQGKLLNSCDEKACNPKALNDHLTNILKSNPGLSAAHYLNFLNSLRVKDISGALNSLHHCFDRPYNADQNADVSKKQWFRFASLSLAILHYHFGHDDEALTCLEEAMILAQEANDNACLQHILTWIYNIKHAGKDKLVQHSIMKSMELNMNYIVSLGIQNFVQYAGVRGGTPKHIFETMTRGDMINCQHPHSSLTCNSYAQKSALWLTFGKTEVSSLWSQLSLYLNSNNNSRLNYSRSICLGMCNVAIQFLSEGEYEKAYAVIMEITDHFPQEPISHSWMMTENFCQFTIALHSEEWIDAEEAANNMAVYDVNESNLCLAELFIQKHDFASAERCINSVLTHGENNPLRIDSRVRASIMLGEIRYISSFPNVTVPQIFNNCVVQTIDFHLDYWHSIVYLHMAYISYLNNMPLQALKIFDSHLIHILTHGGVVDRARTLLLYVRCLMAKLKMENEEEKEKIKIITDCCEMLEDAYKGFLKVEAFTKVKQVLYLQAQLYHELGNIEMRNKCALEFRTTEEEHPSIDKKIPIELL